MIVHGSGQSQALERSFEDVKRISPDSIMIVADFADSSVIDAMFAGIDKAFGRIDILINNAFIQFENPLLDIKQEQWDTELTVNLRAPFLCSQHAARLMRDKNQGGKIINIGSVHAREPKRNFAGYSVSKAGLEMLTKSLAMELAQHNIQANCLILGAIATDSTPPKRQEKIVSSIPADRIGTTDEVARLVAFLCSNECDYITGGSIAVDGGLTLGFSASRPEL